MASQRKDRFRGCLLGLAVGDALGTTVEFKPRGSFPPVTDMVGGGIFRLEAGQWTDDTSMALCLATSLLERGFDLHDQMSRYDRWRGEGYLSSTGTCFDVGATIGAALRRFRETGEPVQGSSNPRTAGNGCIMRLAPVPMFFLADEEHAAERCAESCTTTHGAAECLDAARLLGRMIVRALNGSDKADVLNAARGIAFDSARITAMAAGGWQEKDRADVRGSGYVVECLEAAVWCFANTDTFEDAVLRAVNLGNDADTTGAVCGQLAGAFYGVTRIPPHWRKRVAWARRITALGDSIHAHATGSR